jgi:dTDP-alpha-D-glucose dehydrogenase
MLPPVLHLTPEEIDSPEKRGKYSVALVGCGQKALAHALAFAEAGFRVTCTDVDQSAVKRLSKGNLQLGDHQAEAKLKSFTRKEQVNATSDLKAAVSKADIVVFAMNPKFDPKKRVDTSEVESVCRQVGSALQRGSLFVYAGLVGLGFVEGVVREKLEDTSGLKAGEDFGLAYYPLLDETQEGTVKPLVAADDKYSLNAADLILETATGKVFIKIPNVKVAELASLFAAVKRDVGAALANEVAMFCETARIDYTEIAFFMGENLCKLSAPSFSDEANRDGSLLLLENAENLSVKLRIPAMARQVNEEMARHAVNLTQDALRSGGKTLRRARVALLGAAEPETAAAVFAENLQSKGAKLSRYDPRSANDSSAEDWVALKKTLNETVEGADCVVVLSGQEQLKRLNLKKLHALMKLPAALVDLAGTVEPAKAEKEGFIYRGLGRGIRKK